MTTTHDEYPSLVSSDEADMLTVLFKALSHPVRLRIVSLLRSGEACVCDILAALEDERQSNTSQHLAVLKSAGVVKARREGLNVHYSLCCDHVVRIFDIAFASRCSGDERVPCRSVTDGAISCSRSM